MIKKYFIFMLCSLWGVAGFSLSAQTLGDVNKNGNIDIIDALLTAQYYVGLNPQNFDSAYADVNCSGSVDIVDALRIAQYYVGLVGSFTCTTNYFFDDFIYTSSTDSALTVFGWVARTGSGTASDNGPGPSSGTVTWSTNYITFENGPVNKVLRVKSSNSGSTATQSELDYNKTQMLEGTYAARVYYTDGPLTGNDGAYVVEAPFWTMSDWASTTGTAKYSELDFEYLPNGGWDTSQNAMFTTTWYNDNPSDNVSNYAIGTFAGWHTLIIVVSNGHVKYYDGTKLLADHSGKYYPRSKMNIIPQIWFAENNVTGGTFYCDIDWVYYAQNTVLTAAECENTVNALRSSGVVRNNNLP
jgi:hypothetical protein